MQHATALPIATSLLRHEPPGAPAHVDWLLDLALPTPEHLRGEGDRVPTFRLPERIDSLSAGEALEAERLADHRRLYLELSEARQLTEGRGLVSPLRRGTITSAMRRTSGEIDLSIAWHGDPDPLQQRLRLTPGLGDRWRVEVRSSE